MKSVFKSQNFVDMEYRRKSAFRGEIGKRNFPGLYHSRFSKFPQDIGKLRAYDVREPKWKRSFCERGENLHPNSDGINFEGNMIEMLSRANFQVIHMVALSSQNVHFQNDILDLVRRCFALIQLQKQRLAILYSSKLLFNEM
jgi:hypothetical protein